MRMAQTRIDGIPDLNNPDDPEANDALVTPLGQRTAVQILQMRQRLLPQLALRQTPGHTFDDYLPPAQRERLLGKLPPSDPLFILDESQREWLVRALRDHGIDPGPIEELQEGMHIDVLGASIVWRNPALEQRFGKEYIASIAAHELGHSAHAWKDKTFHIRTTDAGKRSLSNRTGFEVQGTTMHKNTFFEEGFAELMRLRYMMREARDSDFCRAVCVANGVADPSDLVRGDPDIFSMYLDANGNAVPAMPAWALKALLLLTAADSSLGSLINEARSSGDGMKRFWAKIREIVGDKACAELRALQYTIPDGIRGLQIVTEALARRAA